MTLPVNVEHFTPQEYLRREAAAVDRHEYHAGEILAMSGGTYWHGRIATNVNGEMREQLKGSSCFALDSNMRVRLARDDRYVYPDGMVVCGEPQFDPLDKNLTTIINPKLIVEVLSDSTEAYDRGAKFSAYRELESLVEYVLVSQNQPLVEAFFRQPDGTWSFAPSRGLENAVMLRSLNITLLLSEVYAGIKFTTDGKGAQAAP